MAVERVKYEIERGSTCIVIFPNRGERYLETIYSDKWVEEHFGNVAHLWQSPIEAVECVAATAIQSS